MGSSATTSQVQNVDGNHAPEEIPLQTKQKPISNALVRKESC
jgi:hypothetical protein